jgi:hypothetical protein
MFFLDKSEAMFARTHNLAQIFSQAEQFQSIMQEEITENALPSEGLDSLLADRVQKLLLGRLVRRHPEVHRRCQLPDPLAERDTG